MEVQINGETSPNAQQSTDIQVSPTCGNVKFLVLYHIWTKGVKALAIDCLNILRSNNLYKFHCFMKLETYQRSQAMLNICWIFFVCLFSSACRSCSSSYRFGRLVINQ